VRGHADDGHDGLLAALLHDLQGVRVTDHHLDLARTIPHHQERHAGQHPAAVHPAFDPDLAPVSSLGQARSQRARHTRRARDHDHHLPAIGDEFTDGR